MSTPELVSPPDTPKRYYTASEYADLQDEPMEWIIEDVLPYGGSMLMHGLAKQGKSVAIQQLAYALACGDPEWLGFNIKAHGTVLYLQLDTGRTIWKERTRAMNTLYASGLENLIQVDKRMLPQPFDIMEPTHYQHLRQIVKETKPMIVVVDVLRKCSTLGENESDQMMIVLNKLEGVVAPAALCVITHTKKVGHGKFKIPDSELLLGGVRGSGASVGNVDAILMIAHNHLWYHTRVHNEASREIQMSEPFHHGKMVIWKDMDGPVQRTMREVMADTSVSSTAAKARLMAARTGLGEESCRNMLRKANKTAGGKASTSES